MSLYPSLEDMKVDNLARAQMAQFQAPPSVPHQALPSYCHQGYPSAPPSASGTQMYPALADYMGLELSQDVIARNMPEYQVQIVQSSGAVTSFVAPVSSQSTSLTKATVTQAIRQVVVCKDKDGKVGLRLHSVNNGVFVCYVAAGSPAALAGLRFGDQILEINNVALAGMTMDQCHELLRKAPTNGIYMAVRDRPFERTITLHKNSLGHVGFQFKDGKIVALVKDSSAARNGVLTDHQLLEVNTINVVGMKDKDISKVIDESPSVVNITIIPYYIYKHMISKSDEQPSVTTLMDRSLRKSEIQLHKPAEIPYEGSLLQRLSCQTLSKALDMSSNKHGKSFPVFLDGFTLIVSCIYRKIPSRTAWPETIQSVAKEIVSFKICEREKSELIKAFLKKECPIARFF